MKQWLKRILITLALFVSFNANAQNSITIGPGNYGKWLLSNESCYGCGSFYVMVTNTYNPADGFYYYDIYLWSNSYYSNGYTANTYIKGVNIYALNLNGISENLVLNFQYLVVPPKSYQFNGYFYVGYVYSTISTQKIKLNWQSASAW